MTSLVVALILSADGGTGPDFSVPLYGSCREAPPVERVDGGVFYPDARHERVACLLTTCDVDRQGKAKLLAEQPPPPSYVIYGLSIAAAVALGLVLGRFIPWGP